MDQNDSRRDFMKKSAATAAVLGGAGLCACCGSGCAAKTPHVAKENLTRSGDAVVVDLAKVEELKPVGGAVIVKNDAFPTPVIVAHIEEDKYVAVSAKCTHFGRAIGYDAENKALVCGSFSHSRFDLEGKVTKGPAKKDLTKYTASVAEGRLTISA